MSSYKPPALYFKLSEDVCGSLRDVLLSRGWLELADSNKNEWNLQWKTTRYSHEEYMGGDSRNKRINHFQQTHGICKKDSLARNMRIMYELHGKIYNFTPQTFILPREHKECIIAINNELNHKSTWIVKPSSSSQGKNIYLINKSEELLYSTTSVVQRYIANPLLISGYKFDLRIYILVTSFHPLTVYISRLGLVRFSTEKYELNNVNNLYAHLTNASINKHSPEIEANKETIGSGSKWTLQQFWPYIQQTFPHINTESLWADIIDVSLLTLLAIVRDVPHNPRSFELFGFDIMLDEAFKVWLIEVNSSPAIAISNDEDAQVKYPVLNDLLDLIGFQQPNIEIKERKDKLTIDNTQECKEDEVERARPIQTLPRIVRLQTKHNSNHINNNHKLISSIPKTALSNNRILPVNPSNAKRVQISTRMQKYINKYGHPALNAFYPAAYRRNDEQLSADTQLFGCYEKIFPFNDITAAHPLANTNKQAPVLSFAPYIKKCVQQIKLRAKNRAASHS
jgi:tubulin polyglutamylase TTLL2